MRKYDGIKKIISGGQSGADLAGLYFARLNNIETGGYMPNGFLTENGAKPEYAERYGLKEFGIGYKLRTKRNVLESDGTIIFAECSSSGSVLTMRYCRENRKPCLITPSSDGIITWLNDNRIQVLNVAGNRESVSPGIFERVVKLLKASISSE